MPARSPPAICPWMRIELIALCAPRPVFYSEPGRATVNKDGWADAWGNVSWRLRRRAGLPAAGQEGPGTTQFPPMETTLIDGEIAFRQHAGGHTPGPNWPTFMTFASRYLRGSVAAKAHS